MQVGVLAKQKWDMQGEDGKQVKGMKIFTYDGENISEADREGVFLTTFNLPFDSYNLFDKLPGRYELDMSMKAGSKGVFTVTGAKYVGEWKI